MQSAASLQPDPESIAAAIREFIAGARTPVLLDPGEEPLPVLRGSHAVSVHGRSVVVECWSDTQNLVRRVRRIVESRTGRMELEVERFGNRTGKLLLLDRNQPSTAPAALRGVRMQFRERFRIFLMRQFPGWDLAELSSEPDLHHSLSPVYPRALLRRGHAAFAAIGASESVSDVAGVLSFGLIWLDYVRRREKRHAVEGLAVFVPAGAEATVCHRIRYLHPNSARFGVFVHTPEGVEAAVHPGDYTNFDTRLEPFRQPYAVPPDFAERLDKLAALPGVERRYRPDGTIVFRVRGLEFARITRDGVSYGMGERHTARGPWHLKEIEQLAAGIAHLRHAAGERANPLFHRHPEAWLEAQVRGSLREIDATLEASPVYEQAPHLAAGNRGVVDLLAVDYRQRLVVIELKTSEDIHLPLQALDYWMHVKWHLERGEFAANGYFPQLQIRPEPPRLLLVAPELEFHPTNQTVLNYFSEEVPAERVGLGLEWRQELKVVHRAPLAAQWPLKSFGKSDTHSGI